MKQKQKKERKKNCIKKNSLHILYSSTQVDDFVSYVTNMSQAYNTNNVIITMGEDFNYQLAQMWFKNLDKLIK